MLSRPGARKGEEAPPPRPFARALPVGEKVNSSGVAATFKASDYHEVSYPDGRPRYDGEEVLAYVTVPSAKIAGAYTVNQAGEYPRVYTQPKERVEVTMQFSQSEPRTAVAVVVQDGGRLENGSVSQMVRLDEHRRIGFGFKVSSNVGIHRVTVTTSGGQARVLNFWAGAPNPVRDDVAAK